MSTPPVAYCTCKSDRSHGIVYYVGDHTWELCPAVLTGHCPWAELPHDHTKNRGPVWLRQEPVRA